VVFGLTAIAATAPVPPQAIKAAKEQRELANRLKGARAASRPHAIEGVVLHVHRNSKDGHAGTIEVRLGSHYHRQAATAARARKLEHRTVKLHIHDDTRFEKLLGDGKGRREVPVSFHDVHKGERVMIFLKGGSAQVARLVDILEDDANRHRKSSRVRRNIRRTISTGGTTVIGRKVPIRHPLIVGKVLRKLDRIEDALERKGRKGLARRIDALEDRIEKKIVKAGAKHPGSGVAKALKAAAKVERLVEGHKPPVLNHTTARTTGPKSVERKVSVKVGTGTQHTVKRPPSPRPAVHTSPKPAAHHSSSHKSAPSHKGSSSKGKR
jgi:hypothetical protein